jgi:hypothetical protein
MLNATLLTSYNACVVQTPAGYVGEHDFGDVVPRGRRS